MTYIAQMQGKPAVMTVMTEVMHETGAILTDESPEESGKYEERYISETIVYPGVMKGSAVPQTAAAEISCPTGEVLERTLPLTGTEYRDARWEEDLDLTLVFHGYGADAYLFGERRVDHDEENPSAEILEEEIAEEMHVSPDDILITESFWIGDPYRDGSGVLCRDARVLGKRLVYDCSAVYGDTVKIPVEEEETPYPETELRTEQVPVQDTDAAPDFGTPAASEGVLEKALRWVARHITVTVSLSLLLLLILGFLLLRRLARREDRRRSGGYGC